MILTELVNCDIYRDGGSLEGIWKTHEGIELAVSLRIQWQPNKIYGLPSEEKRYTLHNCRMNECSNENRIVKYSLEYQQIIQAIMDWQKQNNSDSQRLPLFINRLIHGNY
jgi:hypothetical protein